MPRTRSQSVLAEDAALYEHLLENMVDVITIIDDAGQLVYQSKSIERMLGYQPEPMLGRQVIDYIHAEDTALVASAIDQLLSGALATNEAEFRFLHANGEYRRIHAVARLWERSGVRGVMVNSRDITQAFEAQEELAKQNELLEKTFSVSKNALSISLPDSGQLLKVNDAWCKTFGFKRENVIGKTAIALGVWGPIENRSRVMDAFQRDGRLKDFEAKTFTSAGDERHVVIDAQLLLVADQPRVLMSCIDVTDSRRTEEQLRQSQKMDAIGQLTGGVAHDFNNLIGVTMGNAELLLDVVADQPKALEHARQIFAAAERGANLTRQLLAFSRRQTLAPEAVNLFQHLTAARSILQTSVSENTVINITSDANLWLCRVDPNQLETALLNLTLNAHDAMPDGGLLGFHLSNYTVNSAEHSATDPGIVGNLALGEYVALAITDTGSGMDAITQSRALEPFFSTKGAGRGTGLGLSMVFGFVEQSGGSLKLESEPGRGTTVTLVLPKVSKVTEVERSEMIGIAADTPDQRKFAASQKTILVVEDNPSLRSVVVSALKDMGYEVLDSSGEEGLTQLLSEASRVDLLLSDVILKERKQGPEIAREVLGQFPNAAVLFMTGYSPDEVLLDTEYPVLMKPFTLLELSKVVYDNLVTSD